MAEKPRQSTAKSGRWQRPGRNQTAALHQKPNITAGARVKVEWLDAVVQALAETESPGAKVLLMTLKLDRKTAEGEPLVVQLDQRQKNVERAHLRTEVSATNVSVPQLPAHACEVAPLQEMVTQLQAEWEG